MTLFTSMDAYWVGTRLGPRGLAAVSTSIFWIWLAVSVAEGVAIGLIAVAARRHGEGNVRAAARVVGAAVFFAFALGAVLGSFGAWQVDALFAVMHTPPEVTALGRDYLRTCLLGLPFVFGFFSIDAAFRAAGDTRTPLILLIVSVGCTLLLDPILILGWGPAPALGIAGAAVALMATRGSAFLVGVVLLHRRRMIDFDITVAKRVLGKIVRVGLPTATTGVIFSLIYIALTRTTTKFGTPALAALGVGHRVESWLYMIGVGFGAAAAAIVGQNIGARQYGRAERAGWLTMAFGLLPALAMCIVSIAIPEQLAGIFTHDPVVAAETASYLRVNAFAQLFLPMEVVLEAALGGAGATVPPMVTSTLLSAARIPLAIILSAIWGPVGIWWAISVTSIARGVAMALLWRSGRWKRKSL
jgi:putative MATE family efflux protein